MEQSVINIRPLYFKGVSLEMSNTAVTYSEWNKATLTGLTFSPGRYMTLVRSVTVNV